MAFEISDIINVTARVSAGGATRRDFGRTLFVSVDDTLPAGGSGRLQSYATQAAVDAVFSGDSEPAQAARAYFGQDPRPRNLLIGRWPETDVSTELIGGTPASVATLAAISAGSFVIGGVAVTGVDLSAATAYADVAAVLQTSLRALTDARFTNAAVDYGTGAFTITLPSRGDIGGGLVDHTAGTALAEPLGLDDGTATYKQGADAETIAEALSALSALDSSFTFFGLEQSRNGTQTMLDAGAWGATRQYIFSAGSSEAQALVANDTTSFAAILSGRSYNRAFLTWSAMSDYKSMAIAGVMSSVNFGQPRSLVTAKFRTLTGFTADDMTESQRRELDRKNINYYVQFGDSPIYAEGVTLRAGTFIDTQYWLDWLANGIQTAIWNQLRSARALPQTASGVSSVRASITTVLEEGVVNGGIAPGQVSPDFVRQIGDTIGDPEFDGFLSRGYLVYIAPISGQSQTDREARKLPPASVWLKGSGAIHSASINLTFEN